MNLTSREIHVFPGEQNAAYYEKQMPVKLRQNYRILRPEVVSLVEDKAHFEMFFKAYAHGFISKSIGEHGGVQHRFWGYQLPDSDEILYLSPPILDTEPPSIFELIQNFLRGSDKRDGYDESTQIDWLELRKALALKEQGMDREKCAELYRAQMTDGPDTIVQIIKAEERAEKEGPAQAKYQKQAMATHEKYLDLADVAKLIYLEAADKLQRPTW